MDTRSRKLGSKKRKIESDTEDEHGGSLEIERRSVEKQVSHDDFLGIMERCEASKWDMVIQVRVRAGAKDKWKTLICKSALPSSVAAVHESVEVSDPLAVAKLNYFVSTVSDRVEQSEREVALKVRGVKQARDRRTLEKLTKEAKTARRVTKVFLDELPNRKKTKHETTSEGGMFGRVLRGFGTGWTEKTINNMHETPPEYDSSQFDTQETFESVE